MKHIKILFIALLASLAVSCDLTEKPHGMYSKENMFSTKEGAESVLLSAYRAYCNVELYVFQFHFTETNTDISFNNRMDDLPYPEISEWKLDLIRTNEWNRMLFKTYYKMIHNACDVIENVPGATFMQEEKDRILGEAYFLRGFAYYNLAWLYGRVPLKLSTTDAYPKIAESLDVLYEQIISDFENGAKLMPIKQVVGCADKVAAWSMLAKTYLYLASAKDTEVPGYKDMNIDAKQAYAKAAEYAKLVVDNPEQTTYYLEPNIMNIYDVLKKDGPEHIFSINHHSAGEAEGEFSKLPMFFLPTNSGSNYYVKNAETGAYDLTTDGWSIIVPTEKMKNEMRENSPIDKRLTHLIKTERYFRNDDGTYTAESMRPQDNTHFDFCAKYLDPYANGTDRTSVNNYIIRFADIVLVYAEALGKDEGLVWLNKVTQRAGGKTYTASEFANDKEFREAVLKERGFELFCEGQRLPDLRRTHNVRAKVDGKVAPNRDPLDLSAYTDEQLTFFPLPQREVELNPNL